MEEGASLLFGGSRFHSKHAARRTNTQFSPFDSPAPQHKPIAEVIAYEIPDGCLQSRQRVIESANYKGLFQHCFIVRFTGSDHKTIAFSLFTRETQRYLNPLRETPFSIKKAN